MKVTKATAKKLARRHASAIKTVEIDHETITLWFDSTDDEDRDAAEKAAQAISKDLGGVTIRSNGYKYDIFYRRQPVDLGDYNDRASRWHY